MHNFLQNKQCVNLIEGFSTKYLFVCGNKLNTLIQICYVQSTHL